MSFSSAARCCLNALGSTSRSPRAAQLAQPQRFILPSPVARSISQQHPSSSSEGPKPKTSSPVVPGRSPLLASPSKPYAQKPTFAFKFSSITDSDTLARVLQARRSITPSDLALLPELEHRQRETALRILTKASEMDPLQRTAYFREVDLAHQPSDVGEQSRREKARKEIESGLFDESDGMSAEEWEEKFRVKPEARLEKLIATKGWTREKALKQLRKDEERSRRRRLERLEVTREMKEAEETGEGSK